MVAAAKTPLTPWVAPFAVSEDSNVGGLVHRVLGLGEYPGGAPGIVLRCGSVIGTTATPLDEPGPGDSHCRRCDVSGLQVAPSVVYLARTPRGIKAGQTKRLVSRMIDLPGQLLMQAPGNPRQERSLLDALGAVTAPSKGREWFPDTPEVVEAASTWFAALSEQVPA